MIDRSWFLPFRVTASLSENLGLVWFYSSGVPIFSPMGNLYLKAIDKLIGDHLTGIGFNQFTMPILHESQVWKTSGRYESFDEKFETGRYVLSATAEEYAALYFDRVFDFNGRDIYLFQHGRKFRNELRPKTLSRCREFWMSDAYSFHMKRADVYASLLRVHMTYMEIFRMLGLGEHVRVVRSSDASMGGNLSFEYVLESPKGESTIFNRMGTCDRTGINFQGVDKPDQDTGSSFKAYELGHIFYLGTYYPELFVKNRQGKGYHAASYGIGISRLIEVLIEFNQGKLEWKNLEPHFNLLILGSGRDKLERETCRILERRTLLKATVLGFSRHVNRNFNIASVYFRSIPLILIKEGGFVIFIRAREIGVRSLDELIRILNIFRGRCIISSR